MAKTSSFLVPSVKPSALVNPRRLPLVEAFLSGRSPRTMEAYRQDLQDFARWIGAENLDEAARLFLVNGRGPANETAHAYRADLLDRKLSPATVNRRLAALRSLVKLARLIGAADFSLDVAAVKSEAYRDTRGPGLVGVRSMLETLAKKTSSKSLRDAALVHLLFDLGLRRGEAVALDLEDVDLVAGTVSILGKGRTEKEALTLPETTRAALEAWTAARGGAPGPLFVNMDRARKGDRLTGRSVARILAAIGETVGLTVRPHGLRHAAVTAALDLTGGDVRKVQRFSRHRDLRTLTKYDDNRLDLGGDVARLVAAGVHKVHNVHNGVKVRNVNLAETFPFFNERR